MAAPADQARQERPYGSCGPRGTWEEAFEAAWARGHALPLEEAIEDTLLGKSAI
jgi:hypothetical protein